MKKNKFTEVANAFSGNEIPPVIIAHTTGNITSQWITSYRCRDTGRTVVLSNVEQPISPLSGGDAVVAKNARDSKITAEEIASLVPIAVLKKEGITLRTTPELAAKIDGLSLYSPISGASFKVDLEEAASEYEAIAAADDEDEDDEDDDLEESSANDEDNEEDDEDDLEESSEFDEDAFIDDEEDGEDDLEESEFDFDDEDEDDLEESEYDFDESNDEEDDDEDEDDEDDMGDEEDDEDENIEDDDEDENIEDEDDSIDGEGGGDDDGDLDDDDGDDIDAIDGEDDIGDDEDENIEDEDDGEDDDDDDEMDEDVEDDEDEDDESMDAEFSSEAAEEDDIVETVVAESANLQNIEVANINGTYWVIADRTTPIATVASDNCGDLQKKMLAKGGDTFQRALAASISTSDGIITPEIATSFGLELLRHEIPVSKVVAAKIKAEVETATAAVKKDAEKYVKRFNSAFGIALAGINKGVFEDVESNPLKEELIARLTKSGVRNPKRIVNAAFEAASEKFLRTVAAKSMSLASEGDEYLNATAKFVKNVRMESVASTDESEFSEDLSTSGFSVNETPSKETASAEPGQPMSALRSRLRGLGTGKR